jgi:hypothetical protein
MSKLEDKRKAALAEAAELLKDMKQDEANAYITENMMITQITKGFMAAYIKKFATSAEDKKWVKEEFKKASTKTATKKVTTVCMGANGVPIHKINKKGQAVAKTVRVDAVTGETYETFDLAGARAEFVKHFGITPKANKFTPKAKRTEPVFDEFDGIF